MIGTDNPSSFVLREFSGAPSAGFFQIFDPVK
jgi:hypothetical protein